MVSQILNYLYHAHLFFLCIFLFNFRERKGRMVEKIWFFHIVKITISNSFFYHSKWLLFIFQYCYWTCSFNWKCRISTSSFRIIISQNVVISTCPTQIRSFKSRKRGTLIIACLSFQPLFISLYNSIFNAWNYFKIASIMFVCICYVKLCLCCVKYSNPCI